MTFIVWLSCKLTNASELTCCDVRFGIDVARIIFALVSRQEIFVIVVPNSRNKG